MSKKSMMPIPSGSRILPKLVGAAVVIALLLVVVQHPTDAANWVQALVNGGEAIVDGIATFFHQITV